MKDYLLQIIGMGPAGIGIAVAADRIAAWEWLLNEGVAFIERGHDMEAHMRSQWPYVVESNSPAHQFLEPIGATGAFRAVLDSSCFRDILSHGTEPILLNRVGFLLGNLGRRIAEMCRQTQASDTIFGERITTLKLDDRNFFTSYNESNQPVARSRFAVLATGAEEEVTKLVQGRFVRPGSRVVTSEAILKGDFSGVESSIKKGTERIYIFGSSHSAISSAQVLCDSFGPFLDEGRIVVIHRGVKNYFSNITEAKSYGHPVLGDTIDPQTGEINRFDGIRGSARQFFRKIVAREETAVSLIHVDELLSQYPLTNGIFVHAIGYAPRPITVLGPDSKTLNLAYGPKTRVVDGKCRIVLEDGRFIPNLFGIGLGNARQTESGVCRVGINIFHGADGECIVKEILSSVACRKSAVAAV